LFNAYFAAVAPFVGPKAHGITYLCKNKPVPLVENTPPAIYAPAPCNKARFALDFVFGLSLRCGYELYDDWAAFMVAPPPRLNYSNYNYNAECLFIHKKNTDYLHAPLVGRRDMAAFLRAPTPEVPFDPFLAIFQLLSRQEETSGKFPIDAHGRIEGRHLFAVSLPLCDMLAAHIGKRLSGIFPNWAPPATHCSFQPTYDVDMAWKYKNKPLLLQAGRFLHDLATLNTARLIERAKVSLGFKKDPFFLFAHLAAQHDSLKNAPGIAQPIFFVQVGDRGRFDKNTDFRNAAFRKMLRELGKKYEIGLHPSYASFLDIKKTTDEKRRLEDILDKAVLRSRQHYLRLRLPESYELLLEAGIRHDHSMGHADVLGFRAGTSRPFQWYDARRDAPSALWVHPFQAMDVTLKNYLNLNPKSASTELGKMIALTKQYGGTFSTIWHNSSFDPADWQGWEHLYWDIFQGFTDGTSSRHKQFPC
jgi:hypothetical protein